MPALPTGTVTFLFTDVEGSTRLLGQHPDAYRAASHRHHDLLAEAVQAHGGLVFETVGDAVYAVFVRPTDGLRAALDGQRAMLREPWGELGAIKVRMGLHLGEVELHGGHYFGAPLYRCGRLMAAAHGGQIVLTEALTGLVLDELPNGAALRDLGEHRLRDLARPERVFQLLHPDLSADFPGLRSLDVAPHNLPILATPFLGREAQLEAVQTRLLRPDVRLLTLTGPGGTGKTRLALQAAAHLLEQLPDGVFFVPLAPVTDPDLVPSAIARALGVQETAGRSLPTSIKEFLRARTLLLLLDNFEQVLEAVPVVADLLGASARLKVLVTSRAVLHLYGEHEFPVPPLALPDRRAEPSAQYVRQFESVRLFVDRAQAARPDFALTDEQAPVLAEICQRLDGLPLAIELAAVRIRTLPPRALLAQMERRLPLLAGGPRDWPARHQTLRQAIGWSYDLLSEAEQTLFRRLAVFVGSWTLEAAAPVVAAGAWASSSSHLPIAILDGLASLVDQSLLREQEGVEDEARFGMLETVREYALEQLEASGEAEPLRQRHAEHFLALAEQAAPELTGPRQGRWLERLEREHDNLRAALDWALERGKAELGLRLAGTLGRFWEVRGFLSEGQRWLDRALALGAAGQPPASAGARSAALHAAGTLAFMRSEYERAAALHQDSLTLRRGLGERPGIATSLHNLSRVRFYQGDHERALALCEESLALRRELGDKRGIAMSLNTLGVIARNRGDPTAARTQYEESLGLFRELGDQWGIGLLLNNLARVARDLGDWTSTAALCTQSLALFQELGDRHGIAWVLSNLAIVASSRDSWERAARLSGAADALRETIGSSSLSLSPAERIAYQAAVEAAHAKLGAETFAAAQAEGRAMPLEQAVALAVGDAESVRPADSHCAGGARHQPAAASPHAA